MLNFIKNKIFDGKNNEHVVGLILGWIGAIGLYVYAIWHNHQIFDPSAFGLGWGAIGVGSGGGKWLAGKDQSDKFSTATPDVPN